MSAHLKLQLQAALIEVRQQQEAVLEACREEEQDPYRTRLPNGEFILAPYIAAKTQLLCAMASLETKK